MYRCRECGEVFTEAGATVWHSETCGDYRDAYCPRCGADDYEDAKFCPVCGGVTGADNLVCESCAVKAREKLESFLRRLHSGMVAYLDDLLETEHLEEIAG